MKKFFILLFCCCCLIQVKAQNNVHQYRLQGSGNFVLDKNFYFITILSKNREALSAIKKNEVLNNYTAAQNQLIKSHSSDSSTTSTGLLTGFKWQWDTTQLLQALADVYEASKTVFDNIINKQLKPSNSYYRFNQENNKDFFLDCWRETFKGINTIIDHYGFNKNFRYPSIDSASYDVNGEYYKDFLKTYFSYLNEQTSTMKLFYEPSLTIALDLMKANERNEPANYEPLEKGENKKAVEQIRKTKFRDYRYSAILVPGEGPELVGVALDPVGRLRCELAAKRYKEKLAPFIIVSGGNVHPFHTKFTEALEMKKYLMAIDSIPESAIIIEPHARHTTTNFRNAERLMICYGIPFGKAALCVSTKDQIDYIMDERFDKRNVRELAYIPYKDKRRLSDHEIEFFVVMDCLQIDPVDPLDP